MTVTAPPRSPRRPSDPVTHGEFDALVEALIEEARQRGRRRRRRNAAVVTLVAIIGAALFAILGRSAQSQTSSPALASRSSLSAAAMSSKIAFTRFAAGGQIDGGLYVMNGDGSEKRKLADGGGIPSWSPDGRKIAFRGRVVNVDGSGLRTLVEDGGDAAWSPGGDRIAYTRYSSDWKYLDIYVMNADGSGKRKLTAGRGGHPVWSPDGQKISFRSRQVPSAGTWLRKFDIYVMNADGSGKRHLAQASFNSDPVWSPDSSQIAFVRGYDIWVMNANGTGKRRLTSSPARDLSPAWSPDGRTIAFDRRIGKRSGWRHQGLTYEIHLMRADGSGQRRLAQGASPLWSPDGEQIAFGRIVGGGVTTFAGGLDNWDIFVMNADGTEQRNVTRNRRWDDCCFAWSPALR